jgi:hypothetical protein
MGLMIAFFRADCAMPHLSATSATGELVNMSVA